MRIGNSHSGSNLIHYECYRAGYPSGSLAPGTTKSVRIDCPFKLNGRFFPDTGNWLLIHTHLGHNHPPDPIAKPRKRPSKKNKSLVPAVVAPPIEQHTPLDASLDSTIASVSARLHALTPHRRQIAIIKIDSILNDQIKGPTTALSPDPSQNRSTNIEIDMPVIESDSPDTTTLHMAQSDMQMLFLNSPDSPNHYKIDNATHPDTFNEPVNIGCLLGESMFSPEKTNPATSPYPTNEYINSLVDDFYGPTENTTSTFNMEELISDPKAKVQEFNKILPVHEPNKHLPTAPTLPTPTPTTSNLSLPAPVTRITRKRARELPPLMKKYRIRERLQPFILDPLGGLKTSGSIYARAWSRRRAGEVSQQEHWLTMPGWGGVIATTFERPVIYYDPGASSQTTFPYLTGPNQHPPIVLTVASLHFCTLQLDLTLDNLPVPRLCKTWRRYRHEDASHWLDTWGPLIELNEQFVKSNNKERIHSQQVGVVRQSVHEDVLQRHHFKYPAGRQTSLTESSSGRLTLHQSIQDSYSRFENEA
ncbi:uncharacterized protein MELLADRAFT_65959 [Melampsora larici-populina 98AG31]|uniref:Uncharacterized protein n=1 Tax=Melampsora larici-populina (strain 98AG31 / pathotype 3-4-7) TaxID=747676 RepID=F4RXD2_MELLP|nr:uncharacterized protein MELLADRAFT_65959 [Melampsora larici-populina 98AG31]EGG02944.1 hypothetical protein MELLADRAFT_65959 [Melampsora larici-populina 98AG31]